MILNFLIFFILLNRPCVAILFFALPLFILSIYLRLIITSVIVLEFSLLALSSFISAHFDLCNNYLRGEGYLDFSLGVSLYNKISYS